jgi:hypothetical protein
MLKYALFSAYGQIYAVDAGDHYLQPHKMDALT